MGATRGLRTWWRRIGWDAALQLGPAITAKQQLRQRVESLSEQQAGETLRLLERAADPLTRRLDEAPLEDEEISAEEEAAVAEGRADLAAGRTVSLDEAMRELD